jgi:hypothetical protein
MTRIIDVLNEIIDRVLRRISWISPVSFRLRETGVDGLRAIATILPHVA